MIVVLGTVSVLLLCYLCFNVKVMGKVGFPANCIEKMGLLLEAECVQQGHLTADAFTRRQSCSVCRSWTSRPFIAACILTCGNKKGTGVCENMNGGCIPFR